MFCVNYSLCRLVVVAGTCERSASAGFSAALFLFSLFCYVVLFQTYDVCGPSHGLGFGLSLYGSIPCFAVLAVLSTPDSKKYS